MIPEQALLRPLPPVPERFEARLSQIALIDGKPLFRLVDGQRETIWRNGEIEVKHLFYPKDENGEYTSCYVPVLKRVYRRKNIKTGEYAIFSSHEAAKKAKDKNLAINLEVGEKIEVRGIGMPCWVIEVYIPTKDVDYDSWQANRSDYLESMGVLQKVDMLGDYPREGMYKWCFNVIDDDGNAVSPSDRTLDECKRRFKIASGDTRTAEQAIQCDLNAEARFEEKQRDLMNDNFKQWAGITATRARAGVVSRPIQEIYGN